jgi:hypothetical protein
MTIQAAVIGVNVGQPGTSNFVMGRPSVPQECDLFHETGGRTRGDETVDNEILNRDRAYSVHQVTCFEIG